MTNTPDLTSPEAVERLARHTEDASDNEYPYCQLIGAALRALSAELEAAEMSAKHWHARAKAAEAERDALKAELAQARRLGATMSRFISGDSTEMGVHAAHEFRAFLARHQKEADT